MVKRKFSTPVDADSFGFFLTQEQHVMMLGSCFTEHIGQRLKENKFDVLVNPFGVLYNPLSIFYTLDFLLKQANGLSCIPEETLFFDGDLWHSWLFSSEFSSSSKEVLLARINDSMTRSVRMLKSLDVLFLTFGTNHAYILRETNQPVANCHKQPERLFEECLLSVSDIEAFDEVLERLLNLRPNLQIVFTVSPYRYSKYGFHGNQLSKSVLLLAAESLQHRCGEHGHYFPAYEIMNDELRDYRFYADDMIHPSALATDYIWEKFVSSWVSREAVLFMEQWHDVLQDMNHRPFNAHSPSYRNFLNKLVEKIMLLSKKYPNLALQNELSLVQSRLKDCEEVEKTS